jgi:hypothetical protein
LNQAAGQPSRLSQEEEADLGDVRPGCDVDQIVFGVRIKGIRSRKIEERLVDLLEVPRIAEIDLMEMHFGLG